MAGKCWAAGRSDELAIDTLREVATNTGLLFRNRREASKLGLEGECVFAISKSESGASGKLSLFNRDTALRGSGDSDPLSSILCRDMIGGIQRRFGVGTTSHQWYHM